ncbi:hypothetical protein SLA2020_085400 [Shorea laevis]
MAKDDFPNDLLTDILFTLSTKSLLRFKSVSRSWCSLIDDPFFVKSHHQRSTEINRNSKFIVQGTDGQMFTISLLDSCSKVVNNVDPPLCLKNMTLRGSCNGLVCLTDPENAILCDISTKDYCKVRFPPYKETTVSLSYGFGYDSINDDYKVVRVDYFYSKQIESYTNDIQVYSLRKDSWNSPQSNTLSCIQNSCRFKEDDAVLLSGALHWVASRNSSNYHYEPNFAIALNLAEETFSKIVLPKTNMEPVMGVIEGCFAVTCYDYTTGLPDADIWVMKDYMVEESWTKLLRISFMLGLGKPLRPIAYSRSSNKILLHSPCCVHLYHPGNGVEHITDCSYYGLAIGPYAESLFSISAYKGCWQKTGSDQAKENTSEM